MEVLDKIKDTVSDELDIQNGSDKKTTPLSGR